MNIGIPLETMTGEGRVALIPEACRLLHESGNIVYVQQGAGMNSGYSDKSYQEYGAEIVDSAYQLYEQAQIIVKVKQPLQQDLQYLKPHHVLFSYLHLAADPKLIQHLCDIGLCAIPFESVVDASGSLPILAPMSQVAGRIAMIRGASLLFRNRGGRGVLLGGVDGADVGRVVVLGAGVAGSHAVAIAAALATHVDVLDIDEQKLQSLQTRFPAIHVQISTPQSVAERCARADLVIGAVLLAGRRAPVVLPKAIVRQMNPGSVIVDIAIDQGGCVEGIHTTTTEELFYIDNGVIHSAVPNMPATVARTASQSLSSAVLPYILPLAESSADELLSMSKQESWSTQAALSQAVAVCRGEVVDDVLQQELSS